MYVYVQNNPLSHIDPTGRYCVSVDGNTAHGGLCGSGPSFYMGYDDDFEGSPIIVNGELAGLIGVPSAKAHYKGKGIKMNYWNGKKPHSNYVVKGNFTYTALIFDYGRTKENHYVRNILNKPPATLAEAKRLRWTELDASESVFHQIGKGNSNNRTNGKHMEAVYRNGILVTDVINLGTYNFYGPDNKWAHAKQDVIPYYIWGNTPDDSTGFWLKVYLGLKSFTISK